MIFQSLFVPIFRVFVHFRLMVLYSGGVVSASISQPDVAPEQSLIHELHSSFLSHTFRIYLYHFLPFVHDVARVAVTCVGFLPERHVGDERCIAYKVENEVCEAGHCDELATFVAKVFSVLCEMFLVESVEYWQASYPARGVHTA